MSPEEQTRAIQFILSTLNITMHDVNRYFELKEIEKDIIREIERSAADRQ